MQVALNEYDDPFCGNGFNVIGTLWDPGAMPIATPPQRVQFETVCAAPVEFEKGM
jgi:hypothetical protein